ncbi:hypothetical protein [Dietzia psychralcaliphila]|uniref:Uncharacterized protein n=1 Tax=Dietzia psychralcaliphila TaxID=139021 RepID=A0AAD0NPE7_9ACTN|nr:hypothetical protein [Dietzia psychralcaliphila]AWH96792.1 hypothetical protein A6048_16320 [Dietzia psychralcaliphila]PTM89439.1 hypothetical protein C8N39_102282 [Dietzia psychralcaliphila]
MVKAFADFLAQFDFTVGSSAAINGFISGSNAALEQSFGFDSSIGRLAVSSIGWVGPGEPVT